MVMEGLGTAEVTDNAYQYNGKEWNEDLGLNWSDYGARWYDAALGRFPGIDMLADTFNFVTPYNYAENEPVAHIDLWGLQKYKPEIQPIENPSDLLSMKMLNNAWEGVKALGREVLTESVGEMAQATGEKVTQVGIATAPLGGGILISLGTALEIGGDSNEGW